MSTPADGMKLDTRMIEAAVPTGVTLLANEFYHLISLPPLTVN